MRSPTHYPEDTPSKPRRQHRYQLENSGYLLTGTTGGNRETSGADEVRLRPSLEHTKDKAPAPKFDEMFKREAVANWLSSGKSKTLTATTLRSDVYGFFFHQSGLLAGLGLQGSKITEIHP